MKWKFSVLEHAQISIKEFFLQAIHNDKKFQDSQACITASVGKLEPVYAKSTVFALRKSKIFWNLISCFLLESFLLPCQHSPQAPQHLHPIMLVEKLPANLFELMGDSQWKHSLKSC